MLISILESIFGKCLQMSCKIEDINSDFYTLQIKDLRGFKFISLILLFVLSKQFKINSSQFLTRMIFIENELTLYINQKDFLYRLIY
jgi:hypothetical protein